MHILIAFFRSDCNLGSSLPKNGVFGLTLYTIQHDYLSLAWAFQCHILSGCKSRFPASYQWISIIVIALMRVFIRQSGNDTGLDGKIVKKPE